MLGTESHGLFESNCIWHLTQIKPCLIFILLTDVSVIQTFLNLKKYIWGFTVQFSCISHLNATRKPYQQYFDVCSKESFRTRYRLPVTDLQSREKLHLTKFIIGTPYHFLSCPAICLHSNNVKKNDNRLWHYFIYGTF